MLSSGGREVSVLVVDDHGAIRKSLCQMLQDSGMQVVGEAIDGREAVRLCEVLRPHVVVLDISMPLLNGFEAARQIARLSPATKIVFLTGHTCEQYTVEAFRSGGAAFVCKQHAAYCLMTAIEAALQGRHYISGQSAA